MSRVALIGENSIEYIDLLLDIWNHGDCALLLDWRIPFQALLLLMEEADVHSCYIEKNFFRQDMLPSTLDIKFELFERKSNSTEYLPKEIYSKFQENYSRDEAVVIYSSGTTGKSKGVILSHFAIQSNADSIIDYMKITSADVLYIVKTLSHAATLIGELLVALKAKADIVIAPTITLPSFVLKNIEEFKVSILCVNPILLSLYAKEMERSSYEISSLKVIYVSGSMLEERTYEAAKRTFKGIPLYNAYGLSEAGPRVASQREGCLGNSVGYAINGVDIAIVDNQGNILSTNEYGIIHVNTLSRFSGYISGFEKQVSLYKDWLNTGDVGYWDENGELHIVDRIDDVMIIDSHKIYPSEVEKQIIRHTDISECMVVKVRFHGNHFIGCLYTAEKTVEKDFRRRLKDVLASYEIPRCFVECVTLPCTLNGKYEKKTAKKIIIDTLEKRRVR